MTDLVIKVKVDGDDAKKGLQGVGDQVKDLAAKSEGFGRTAQIAIGSFIGTLASSALTKGIEFLKGAFDAAIDGAAKQEVAIIRLNNSLKLNGEFSEVTSKGFQKFAESLALVSQQEDDVILAQISIAKSFGATNEQAKKIVETAADMSFALGKDFGATVLELSATLEGSAGRLGKIDGRIKDLGETGLTAGQAIDILNSKFKGSAKEGIDSYTGSIGQLKKAIGELLESFGGYIVNSSLVKGATQGITDAVNSLNASFNKTNIQKLNDELAKYTNNPFFSKIGIGNREKEIALLQKQIQEEQRILADEKVKALEANEKSVAIRKEKLAKDQAAADLKLQLEVNKKKAEELKKAIEQQAKDDAKYKEDLRLINLEENRKLDEQSEKKKEAAFKQIEKQEDDASKQAEEQKAAKEGSIASGIGIASNVLSGAAGVTGLIKAGMTAAFGPIGQALGPLVDTLAQGPEKVQAMVKEFVDAVPIVVKNIILSIPVLVTSLVKAIPTLIKALVAAIPEIIRGFIAALPELINALIFQLPLLINSLAMQMPFIAITFITEMIKGIPYIVSGIAEGALQAILDLFNQLNPFSSDGFLGNLFASGGEGQIKGVPSGFPNDSFPARLTEGELVIDQSTTRKLKDFLNGDQGGGGGVSNSILTQILMALQSPMSVQSSVTVDKSVFASIMLEINRTNRRTL